jgi:carbonic anhydrase
MSYGPGSILGRMGSTVTTTLAQFHFHAPSEHAVDGASYPMEMHLVHVDAAGKPAVVVGGQSLGGRTVLIDSTPGK